MLLFHVLARQLLVHDVVLKLNQDLLRSRSQATCVLMLSAEVIFPSAPNWYLAHAVDALPDGTVALATNQARGLGAGARPAR